MDLYHLRTFVAVAREGSITRAAGVVHLSQPAVSAHIKEMEDVLGLALFERSSRGMTLTAEGSRLLARAEQTLAAHRAMLDEAARSKAGLRGRLRLGASSNSDPTAIGRLVATMSERFPDVEVTLRHGRSDEIVTDLRNDILDAVFYNEGGQPRADLTTIEVSRFKVFLVGSKGTALDWNALADVPWIFPPKAACCGRVAEAFFSAQGIRPGRIVSVDTQAMIATLVCSGLGVGLLHEETARQASREGELQLLAEAAAPVRVLFAYRATRAQDPVLTAASVIVRSRRQG